MYFKSYKNWAVAKGQVLEYIHNWTSLVQYTTVLLNEMLILDQQSQVILPKLSNLQKLATDEKILQMFSPFQIRLTVIS